MLDMTRKLFEENQSLNELTPTILNCFVSKIVVDENGNPTIHYQFSIPLILEVLKTISE